MENDNFSFKSASSRESNRIFARNLLFDADSGDNDRHRLTVRSTMEPGAVSSMEFNRASINNNDVGNARLSTRMNMDVSINEWNQGDVQYDYQMEDIIDQLPSQQIDSIAEMAVKSLKRKRPSTVYRGSQIRKKESEMEEEIIRSLEHDLVDDAAFDNLDTAIRSIPTTLSRKRNIKQRLSSRKSKKVGRRKYFFYSFGMAWQHFKYNLKNALGLFDLWRSHLVTIEGHFGTSVVSYFIFLKWVLLINIPLFLLTFAFLVFPQILFRLTQQEPRGYEGSDDFEGIELLTGRGFFEKTEMYYGFYTNETVEAISSVKYKMKYAYLFTCGGYYLFCLIILAYSYLRSYQKYYIHSSGALSQYYFSMVLCGWDYGITLQETANLKQKSIYNELKECMSGKILDVAKSAISNTPIAIKWLRRIFLWLIILGLLGGAGYLTYIISVDLSLTTALANETSIPVVSPLAMPVVISSMHLIIPMIFTLVERFEEYSEPKFELYIHMFRDMALKATILAVLVLFWFDIAASELKCWETFVGQEIYRLVVVDLIFTLCYSFFMEFVRKLFSRKFTSIERSEFAVGRHTLELIYSQSLCWLGVYYCPIIPIITILKLIIIFYVKRYSVINNCQSSLKPWRASRTHTVFVGYLFGFFILCLVHIGCLVSLMKPSTQCGPYKQLESSYDVVNNLVDEWKSESPFLKDFFNFVTAPGFIAGCLVFFTVILYYMRINMLSHQSMVEQMKMQLNSEGKDKRFLMNLLNQVKLRGRRVSKHPGPALYKAVNAHTTNETTTGKVFVRSVAESLMSSPQGK